MIKHISQLALIMLVCLMIAVPVKADINYDLIYNWSLQPSNVQNDLVRKNTNIQVVDQLDWYDPSLLDTYAYSRFYQGPYGVYAVDMRLKSGYEYTLSHEVGHVVSNFQTNLFWWCEQPVFEQIWLAERYNNVVAYQGWYNKYEWFACCYDMYIRYPELLKKWCPMTYNYIKVVLSYT